MKYILCQPANMRFKWELEVLLTNLGSLGVAPQDVVLLFLQEQADIPDYFRKKYGVCVYDYLDTRDDKSYIPSIRPFLWWQYLKEDKARQAETYFYLDSDVIFRELPDFQALNATPNKWLCSDCNGYLNLDYLRQCDNGAQIIKNMAAIVGVSVESLETINYNSGGAQWVICSPTVEYWQKVYEDCNRLWHYLSACDSNVQKWTAEMWSQLWNMLYFNIGPLVSNELAFCWATDDIQRFKETKILHNAGVTDTKSGLFYKGAYLTRTPFFDDLDVVHNKCSYEYVKALKKVKRP